MSIREGMGSEMRDRHIIKLYAALRIDVLY